MEIVNALSATLCPREQRGRPAVFQGDPALITDALFAHAPPDKFRRNPMRLFEYEVDPRACIDEDKLNQYKDLLYHP